MKIPVDECPAGLMMDAAAEKAQGVHVQWRSGVNGTKIPVRLLGTIASRDSDWVEWEDWQQVPLYSTDIAAAWGLAETFRHGRFFVGWSEDWGVPYCRMGDAHEYAETIPLVICRAFLKANGVTEVEDVAI